MGKEASGGLKNLPTIMTCTPLSTISSVMFDDLSIISTRTGLNPSVSAARAMPPDQTSLKASLKGMITNTELASETSALGFCLGTQFKWNFFLLFCERFLANRQANIHSLRQSFHAYLQKDPGLYRSDRRTGENGPYKSSSEPGRRRPSGTDRLNYNHVYKTRRPHAASSVIIASSFALAPLAQTCHLGITVTLPST
jgi:hypothetical protein